MFRGREAVAVIAYVCVVAMILTGISLGVLKYKQPPHVISFHPGGYLHQYYKEYTQLRRTGGVVIVDGMCLSACTLLIGLIPADQICATPYAILGFHSATAGPAHSSEGTRLIWQTYPIALRRLLVERGWNGDPAAHRSDPTLNRHPEMIYIAAPEIYEFIQRCPE